jgi:hypothetical protein
MRNKMQYAEMELILLDESGVALLRCGEQPAESPGILLIQGIDQRREL